MEQLLYIEIPQPDIDAVKVWLHEHYRPIAGQKIITPDGIRLLFAAAENVIAADRYPELSLFVWSVQRTTYLKVFRWAQQPVPSEQKLLRQFVRDIRQAFPYRYPTLPAIDLSQQSIFAALAPYYPQTVKFFQRIPNGDYDLTRVYWWEQRWREGVQRPRQPNQVVFNTLNPPDSATSVQPIYDLIYVGGALGVIHAAMMARLGYRVLLIERLPFGRMNREWNISRDEFQQLIDIGLFTPQEFETLIAREYVDGFHKFFDANNPPQAKAAVLHTPTVLNVSLDAEALLRLCGEKLQAAGGEIWDETEFTRVEIAPSQVTVYARQLPTGRDRQAVGRLVVDAMGTASPIAWQLNNGRAFDSVCPTVGAAIASGFPPGAWDHRYGDVLFSHGDSSRGRQLIWELFPGKDDEVTIYLFHYHQIHPDNPGSLLELYEDFFTILPEYRRCDLDQLVWRKATFGYIPGYFSTSSRDRRVAFDRLVAIGDAASLQSPLVFTGFGSLVRNLPRLTDLLDTALRHDLLTSQYLNQIRAHQSNVAVTWLFSKGMMVPTGQYLPPERINATLNTFFGILANEPPEVADKFIKDRIDWLTFNQLALKAAVRNPALLWWIWQLAGWRDLLRWLLSYVDFTWASLKRYLLKPWITPFMNWIHAWLEPRYPALWLWLLAQRYEVLGSTSERFRAMAQSSTTAYTAPSTAIRSSTE
ncbi:MAG: flavin-dependent dehydrogenase [Cyanobacteria bacterium]|nr:flavin-dependent dehydrogenase [Cyanobacteriota bacterium]MDW8200493.1 flavin-dependent dehydrogenase [Cyanobacteriota bacterium SKYGB_h_bin112]